MAMPASSAAVITSASRIRAARLDHRRGAGLDRRQQARSANGKKASDATTEPSVRGVASPSARPASSALIAAMRAESDPAHLPRPDADGGAALRIDDGIRLDVLGDPEGEQQVLEFGRGRRSASSRPSGPPPRVCPVSRGLDQEAAGDRAHHQILLPCGSGRAAGQQQSGRFFFADNRSSAPASASGAITTSVKISAIASAVVTSSGRLQATMHAEGADRVAGQRLQPGLDQAVAGGDPAGVGMLDDRRSPGPRTRRPVRTAASVVVDVVVA